MRCLKEGIKIVRFLLPWQDSKNAAPVVVDDYDPKTGLNVIIPQTIAIIEKT
jgi:hypothetical protein